VIQVPTNTVFHLVFDLLAWATGAAVGWALYRWRLKDEVAWTASTVGSGWFVAVAAGAVAGAWLAGSLNTLRDADPALSHSIVGALVGAIVGVEIYKRLRGIEGSTGAAFAGSFATGAVIGRLGCLFSGLADRTYGTPTGLPWAVDLGDGIGRHPVQLYESGAILLFLLAYVRGLAVRAPWAMRRGFYALCIVYGAQRFCWEFLKPYPTLIGPFNLFHGLSLALVVYGVIFYGRDVSRARRDPDAAEDRALSVLRPDNEPV
jgi:prolipoprotein diacylglyceryltransferase